jgi:hypothetical protein
LFHRAKVICQNQNDLSNEIRNIRHDLMPSEYPKEFIDSVLKPPSRNHPSSDKTYQGTAVIPYVKGIAEKFRRIETGPNSEQSSKLNIHYGVH